MKKGFILGFACATLLTSGVAFATNALSDVYTSSFPIKINGQAYTPDMPVLNYQGRTYLALREFGTVTGNTIDFQDNTIIVNTKDYVSEITNSTNIGNAFTYDKNGKKYELKITGIKQTKDRNQFSDKEPAQVFIVDYEYKNISGNDLYISDINFRIVDEKGQVGNTYPLSYTYPQSIPVGTTCKAQMVFAVNNKSSNVTLHYYDNMFNNSSDKIFTLDVN